MSYSSIFELPENALCRVSPADVQNYVCATGWRQVQNIHGDIAVYRRPENEDEEIIVPQNRSYSDYTLRMAEAITTLSEVERRTPTEILSDLLLSPAHALNITEKS